MTQAPPAPLLLLALALAAGALGARVDAADAPSLAPPFLVPFPEVPDAQERLEPFESSPPPPVELAIPSISVRSHVVPVGLDPAGALATPLADRVGWWRLGARPGEPGSAVLAGHVDTRHAPGVFARLPELVEGSTVAVRRADGSVAVFTVVGVTRHDKEALPPAVWERGGRRLLRLITCGGEFDERARSYRENVVVHALGVGVWRPTPTS
jgi:sortase (surface protein transpeptidase)